MIVIGKLGAQKPVSLNWRRLESGNSQKLFDNNHGIIAEVFGIAYRVVTLPRKFLLCPINWGT